MSRHDYLFSAVFNLYFDVDSNLNAYHFDTEPTPH